MDLDQFSGLGLFRYKAPDNSQQLMAPEHLTLALSQRKQQAILHRKQVLHRAPFVCHLGADFQESVATQHAKKVMGYLVRDDACRGKNVGRLALYQWQLETDVDDD